MTQLLIELNTRTSGDVCYIRYAVLAATGATATADCYIRVNNYRVIARVACDVNCCVCVRACKCFDDLCVACGIYVTTTRCCKIFHAPPARYAAEWVVERKHVSRSRVDVFSGLMRFNRLIYVRAFRFNSCNRRFAGGWFLCSIVYIDVAYNHKSYNCRYIYVVVLRL